MRERATAHRLQVEAGREPGLGSNAQSGGASTGDGMTVGGAPARRAEESGAMTSLSLRVPKAGLIGAAALAAAALAGCETVGSAAGPKQFAVLETDTTGATTVNIASLSDVIARNPND